MSYEPYQQRVVTERDEIKRRKIILGDFCNPSNPVFRGLSTLEKELTQIQMSWIEGYLGVLESRIRLFGGKP